MAKSGGGGGGGGGGSGGLTWVVSCGVGVLAPAFVGLFLSFCVPCLCVRKAGLAFKRGRNRRVKGSRAGRGGRGRSSPGRGQRSVWSGTMPLWAPKLSRSPRMVKAGASELRR